MNDTPQDAHTAAYRALAGLAESAAAIDEVIDAARETLRIFDITLGQRFDSPQRIERIRRLLVAGRAHRVLIALHETEPMQRDCPRLLALLRQFPMSIEIHRTLGEARKANDPFVLADDHSVWHQMHYTQPRAIVAVHSPPDALPLAQRFEDIWALSEPAVSSTTLGL